MFCSERPKKCQKDEDKRKVKGTNSKQHIIEPGEKLCATITKGQINEKIE